MDSQIAGDARTRFVLLGYLGAASDHRVETFASGAGLALLLLVLVG